MLKTQTLSEIASGAVIYKVPPFQRDYAWSKEQCQDLWNDIQGTIFGSNEKYFLGVLILLEESQGKKSQIIDGQQRLTCLWLLMVAALSLLKADKRGIKNVEILKNRYIQFQDIDAKPKIKLVLNQNNNYDFEYICNRLEVDEKRNKNETESKINDTFRYWLKKLESKFKVDKSFAITKFLDRLVNRLIFTVFVSNKKWSAYQIFETTNNRGVKLTSADLLKNYLISCLADDNNNLVEDLDNTWFKIGAQFRGLQYDSFNNFIRYHHAFTYEHVTERVMFKKIKEKFDSIKGKGKIDKIWEYVSDLQKFAPFFAALQNSEDKLWTELNFEILQIDKVKFYLNFFKKFKFKQPFLILTVALYKFKRNEFLKLLKNVYVISVRYNVICYMTANQQEKNFGVVARKIYTGQYSTCDEVLRSLEFKNLYQDDIIVKDKFKKLSIKNSKKAIHILTKIENYYNSHNINEDAVSIERILPKNFWENKYWSSQFKKTKTALIDRLGNMTILPPKDINRKLLASSFSDKRPFYATSNFAITRDVFKFNIWNESSIDYRQGQWSDIAVKIWQISKLKN